MRIAAEVGVTAIGAAEAEPRPAERPSASIVKILEGALRIVDSRGINRLTMRDISLASGVSRATLYRYFSTKDDVLDAVSEYVCVNFETGVSAVADAHSDPVDRFRAVMAFFSQYSRERAPEPMLEIEPGFYLAFFRSHFARYKVAVFAALRESFDHFDRKLGTKLNRAGIAEALIRMQLSTLMVPAEDDWLDLWNQSPDIIAGLIETIDGRKR